jgi:hypothetical protein
VLIRSTSKNLPPLTRRQTYAGRKPIAYRQLCAVVRSVLEQEPSIDDAEWKERTKCRLVALGFDYPTPAELAAVLSAVERALVKRWGLRPVPMPLRETPVPDARPLSHDEARAALQDLARNVGTLPPIKPMPRIKPLTIRGAERHRALQIVMQAIRAQVQRCEEAER